MSAGFWLARDKNRNSRHKLFKFEPANVGVSMFKECVWVNYKKYVKFDSGAEGIIMPFEIVKLLFGRVLPKGTKVHFKHPEKISTFMKRRSPGRSVLEEKK